jgi:PD-(D/E)XK nuclease superfamily
MPKTKAKTKVEKPAKKAFRRLDGEQRFYEVEGIGKFPSVTTVLGVIDKPALIGWAKKQVALAIQPILQDIFNHKIKPEELDVDAIIKMAKQKPKSVMEEAGDIGTQVHHHLEEIVKLKIKNPKMKWEGIKVLRNVPENTDERVLKCVNAFFKWVEENHFIPVESELMIYSKSIGYAGTLDAVGFVNGVLSVIDFKSSKAFYPEMGIQLSAYRHAYAEMRDVKKVSGMLVLRLGKEDGDFEVIKVGNAIQNMVAFKGALAIWKWKNPIKE